MKKLLSVNFFVLVLLIMASCSQEADSLLVDEVSVENFSEDVIEYQSTSAGELTGDWLFLGYEADDQIGPDDSPTPLQDAYMSIEAVGTDEYHIFGMSFVNIFLAFVTVENGNPTIGEGFAATLRADSDENMAAELKFLQSISESTVEVDGDRLYVDFGDDRMVFTRK